MKHIRHHVSRLTLISAVIALALLVPVRAQGPSGPVLPGATWEYVARENLAAHGWSADALTKTTEFIRDDSNTTGLVVVDRGRVVYRYGDIEELSYIASVRKSILAMLYGYWVENGTIKLNTTLEQLGMDASAGCCRARSRPPSRAPDHRALGRLSPGLVLGRRPRESAAARLAEARLLHALLELGLQHYFSNT